MSTPLAARWAVIVAVWAAAYAGVDALHRLQAPHRIATAEYLPAATLSPPAADATGAAVVLPHNWAPQDIRERPYGWYRLEFDYTPDGTPWAIYIASAAMNAAVLVNGSPVGSGGEMGERVSRNLFRPLLLEIPARLLQPGRNAALVLVRGVAPRPAFLGTVSIGPRAELSPYYALRQFLKVEFMHLLVVFLLTISIPTAVLWFFRRHETAYLWHSVTAWLYCGYVLNHALPDLPVPPLVRDLFSHGLVAGFIMAIVVLIHRFVGLRPRRLERALWISIAAGVAGLAALAHFAPVAFGVVAPLWDAWALGLCVIPGWVMLRAYWRLPGASVVALMLAGYLQMVLGAHDLLVSLRVLPPFDGYYLFYVSPVPPLVFTWILLERFRAALGESETLNRELAMRVERKSVELEAAYSERRKLEQERAITEERERILRDMHDGLGGRLVSTLARLESAGQGASGVAQTVRESLADLRLIIYSLEPSAQDLRAALALMRDRLGAACADAGLAVDWQLHELPDPCVLGPRDTLQVMRVVQEAVTNVLKHARARRLEVHAGAATRDGQAGVHVCIADDGVGVPRVLPGGTGFASMRRRASQLRGAFEVEPLEPGTRVCLWVPLPA